MSPEEPERAIDRVAGAVADGTPVDWKRERAEHPEVGPELTQLEALSRLRSLTETTKEERMMEEHRKEPTAGGRPILFTWGRLLIVELLGQGSFGQVYRAFDPALEIDVALKLRHLKESDEPASIDAFLAEARRLARVRHTNVVRVYGADVHDERVGIWSELIEGETLEQRLAHGPMGATEALGIGLDLCRALAAVHAENLLHRDVKTPNIMKERGGRIVLMDFGSGSEIPRGGRVGETLRIHGTPLYMPLEQLHGKISGPPMDIYSVGVVLYRLVSHQFPIDATSIPELIDRHARGPEPLLNRRPDLPSAFIDVVHRALSTRPEDRYQSAGEMERAIAGALSAVRDGSDSESRWKRLMGWLRHRGWIAAGVGVAVLLALALSRDDVQEWLGWKPDKKDSNEEHAVSDHLMATPLVLRRAAGREEQLLPGARVHVGDSLSMTIQGSDPMYLYVLNEDAKGHVYVLFPLPELEPQNPLEPGALHHLPGIRGGRRYFWRINSLGGREMIVAFASKKPDPTLERELGALPRAQEGAPQMLSEEAADRLRGIGGVVSEPEPDRPKPGLAEILARFAAATTDSKERPFVWQIELENPTPASP